MTSLVSSGQEPFTRRRGKVQGNQVSDPLCGGYGMSCSHNPVRFYSKAYQILSDGVSIVPLAAARTTSADVQVEYAGSI
jgi:hypothetical protein